MLTEKTPSAKAGADCAECEPLDAATVAEMNRQYEAIEQSLHHYIDQRLAGTEKRESPRRASSQSFASSERRWWFALAGLIGLALIALGIYRVVRDPVGPIHDQIVEQLVVPADAPAPVYTEPSAAAPERTPADRAVAAAGLSGEWANAFRDILTDHSEFASQVLASLRVPSLKPFLRQIASGTDLQPEGRELLRGLILEGIVAKRDPSEKIDGKLTAADLNRLRRTYEVKSTRAPDVQSEIILRWMASRGR